MIGKLEISIIENLDDMSHNLYKKLITILEDIIKSYDCKWKDIVLKTYNLSTMNHFATLISTIYGCSLNIYLEKDDKCESPTLYNVQYITKSPNCRLIHVYEAHNINMLLIKSTIIIKFSYENNKFYAYAYIGNNLPINERDIRVLDLN